MRRVSFLTLIFILSFAKMQAQICNFITDGNFDQSLTKWVPNGSPDIYPNKSIFMWGWKSLYQYGDESITQDLCQSITVPSIIGKYDLKFDAATSARDNGKLEVRLWNTSGGYVVLYTVAPPQLTTTMKTFTAKNVLKGLPNDIYDKITIIPVCNAIGNASGGNGPMDIIVDNIELVCQNNISDGNRFVVGVPCCLPIKLQYPGVLIRGKNILYEWIEEKTKTVVSTDSILTLSPKINTSYTYLFRQTIDICSENNLEKPCVIVTTDTVVINTDNVYVDKTKSVSLAINTSPNPFSSKFEVAFSIPNQSDISMRIIDCLGKVVKQISARKYDAGSNKLNIDTDNLQTGLYLLIINTEYGCYSHKIICTK